MAVRIVSGLLVWMVLVFPVCVNCSGPENSNNSNSNNSNSNNNNNNNGKTTLEAALEKAIPLTLQKVVGGVICASTRIFDFYTSWGKYTGSTATFYEMDFNRDGATLVWAVSGGGRNYKYGSWMIDPQNGKVITAVVGDNNETYHFAAFNAPEGGQVVVDATGRVWECCDYIYGKSWNCTIPP